MSMKLFAFKTSNIFVYFEYQFVRLNWWMCTHKFQWFSNSRQFMCCHAAANVFTDLWDLLGFLEAPCFEFDCDDWLYLKISQYFIWTPSKKYFCIKFCSNIRKERVTVSVLLRNFPNYVCHCVNYGAYWLRYCTDNARSENYEHGNIRTRFFSFAP